ncbi:ER membrane protein complex subunit 2 [Trametes pubescens]|uniref:ER membrane protein complex subunit 2 n=1 Tax=Trametes pubescens TaxID=154538 RepID=A0A1M2V9F0_TRAPU|nr:ER membrane protein complex subunit 2 [Trametes pubescens]
MEVAFSLQKLAAYKPRKTQKSKETLDAGLVLLENGGHATKGEAGWDAIEKLALAALDQGNTEVADRCIRILSDKFPDSPRVHILTGIRLEATEKTEAVLRYYDELLEENSSTAAAWQRKAHVLRQIGKVDRAVEELSAMLDTFYTEVEGWIELADIYLSCQQYTYALQSLSHALLLSPQNPSYFLQFAETAYLAEDIPLSLKMFLQTVDMTDDDDGDIAPGDSVPSGITLRAWFGVKLCVSKLIAEPRAASSSPSQTAAPSADNLNALANLSTERLRTAYLDIKHESPPTGDNELIAALTPLVK